MQAAGALTPTGIIFIVVLVLLLFGGKKLRTFGSDLGEAIKGFKNSLSGDDKDKNKEEDTHKLEQQNQQQQVKQAEKNEHKD